MPINITRNDAGNCINFVGSTDPAYWNGCLEGQVSAGTTDRIDVINNVRTQAAGETKYEFYRIPFTNFADADGVAFPDAATCAAYITAAANVAGDTGTYDLTDVDFLDFHVDATDTTVLLDNGDSYAVNSIQAADSTDGHIMIVTHTNDKVLYRGLRVANATIGSVPVNANLALAVNELNALFSQAGSPVGAAPVITSATAIQLAAGDTLNYELLAQDGVGYEWVNLPIGVVTVDGNSRKLLGGSALSAGDYIMTAKAINYFGEDEEDITLTVTAAPYSNTKSTNFVSNDYLTATASDLDTTLGRVGNGSGAGDAWSISTWFKPGTHTGPAKQSIFYFGDDDYDNAGHIWIFFKGSDRKLRVEYGSKNNDLELETAAAALTIGTWSHILLTYDGGTTGSSSGSISNYYSRFKLYVDGALVSMNNSNSNYGWSSGIAGDKLVVGRKGANNDWMKDDCRIDELAVWLSDQNANVAAIYNGGVSHDLAALGSAPAHYWRMGDGDVYPLITDRIGSTDFTMTNMVAADLVTDTP